jgi:hypothetical protein
MKDQFRKCYEELIKFNVRTASGFENMKEQYETSCDTFLNSTML